MAEWHFIPWNMQYLGGGLLALITTIAVFTRNPKTSSYKCFLAYGACVVVWMFSVLFARNAPLLSYSTALYRIVLFSFALTQPLLLLTVLQIGSRNRKYYLTLLPSLFVAFYSMMAVPFDVSSTSFGWAYSLRPRFASISTPVMIIYPVAIVIILLVMVMKSKLLYLRRKYSLILSGFLLYVTPLMISNMAMWRDTNIRPIGGFLLTIEFLFIAYALYLRPEKIEFTNGLLADTLNDNLFRFVRRIREIIPGRELGGDAAYFIDVLQSMGIADTVYYESNRQIFTTTRSERLDMQQIMNRITGFIRKEAWALQASREYTDLFVELYRTLSKSSTLVANDWLNTTLRRHGGFLDKQGILAAIPVGAELPPIFRELQSGKVYLFREEKPVHAYEKLNRALEYSFEGICVSKLEPQKVRATYGVEKASLFWLTFQQTPTEEAVSPKDLERLTYIISLGIVNSSRTVILLDGLDQIIFANSFEKVRDLLGRLKKLCEDNRATLLVSINAEMIKKQQMEAIEQDLGEVK